MYKKVAIKKKKPSFKEAVAATPDVCKCHKDGKQAVINAERNKVELSDSRKCGGSLFIDGCLVAQNKYPYANRWDYAIDYSGEVYFFEVHTASDSEVSTVLKKLQWLKDWLHHSAPIINSLKSNSPFYWIQSNGYHISKNSKYERQAMQSGIRPISKLILK